MIFSFNKKKLDYDFSSKNEELEKDTQKTGLYLDFYNLKKPPFNITPDPEFLYSSSTHKTVIENILYGIKAGKGFLLLIGEVGTGKTTLCRAILDELEESAETVYLINPSLSGIEIIQAILDDLGLDCPAGLSKKALLDRLNRFLLEVTTQKPVVIIIDDAQTMTSEGLENLRLLSNLETDKKKLLQMVLVGQQELHDLLAGPELRQLKQRVTVCCQLDFIGYNELRQYIYLRLFVAGDNGKIRFTDAAVKEIHRASGGIPRLINIICDYALTAAYISNSFLVKKEHTRRAVNELRHQSLPGGAFYSGLFPYFKKKMAWPGLLILFTGLLILTFFYGGKKINKDTETVTAQTISESIQVNDSADSIPDSVLINDDISPAVNGKEESSATGYEPAVVQGVRGSAAETPANYILQISSLKTLDAAVREGLSLRRKGLDVHWNAVHLIEKGTWHRVYKGGFSTKKEAMAFKEQKGIAEGIIIYAPWTIAVSPGNQAASPEETCSLLQEKGLDCTLEKNEGEDYSVTSGAFRSLERAQKAVREIVDMGLDAEPVLRQAGIREQ